MNILLGSKNPSKKRAVELALQELGINDYNIECIDSKSDVPSKPIGYEIIRGADNRNQYSKTYAETNKINYDFLCAIEGGYSLDENGIPFIVTYCIFQDFQNKKSTGKSLGIRLSKDMFDYIKSGNSLNKLIETITQNENNKSNSGITGYLSNGIYDRDKMDKDAVISAFIPFQYSKQRNAINNEIKKLIKKADF